MVEGAFSHSHSGRLHRFVAVGCRVKIKKQSAPFPLMSKNSLLISTFITTFTFQVLRVENNVRYGFVLSSGVNRCSLSYTEVYSETLL